MSEGELLQLEKSRKLNLDESIYFEIITNKTASLLASACAVGTYTTTQNIETTEIMRNFGEKVGIAFQIKDDLFDYGTDKVGKPTGNDIREKKLTLPLIYTLNKVDKSIRKRLIYILKNKHKNQTEINFVIEKVIEAGGIEYATKKMHAYRDEALSILHQFDKTAVRDELESLVRFTTDRKY